MSMQTIAFHAICVVLSWMCGWKQTIALWTAKSTPGQLATTTTYKNIHTYIYTMGNRQSRQRNYSLLSCIQNTTRCVFPKRLSRGPSCGGLTFQFHPQALFSLCPRPLSSPIRASELPATCSPDRPVRFSFLPRAHWSVAWEIAVDLTQNNFITRFTANA